jgi:hypothetical protein
MIFEAPIAPAHMRSGHYFSLTEPWASLGMLRRVARVCRIVFGCIMSSFLLLAAVYAACGLFFSPSVGHALLCIAIVLHFTVLAWAVGCMFIWRGVYPPHQPSSGGLPPPEPPTEGAPRPAPLRPFSPLVQSAHAQLPNDRSAS